MIPVRCVRSIAVADSVKGQFSTETQAATCYLYLLLIFISFSRLRHDPREGIRDVMPSTPLPSRNSSLSHPGVLLPTGRSPAFYQKFSTLLNKIHNPLSMAFESFWNMRSLHTLYAKGLASTINFLRHFAPASEGPTGLRLGLGWSGSESLARTRGRVRVPKSRPMQIRWLTSC